MVGGLHIKLCGQCWEVFSDGNSFTKHTQRPHFWCEECRLVLLAGKHKTEHDANEHAENPVCAVSMVRKCCGQPWAEFTTQPEHQCRGREDMVDPYQKRARWLLHQAQQRQCPRDGCDRWLTSYEQAILHLPTCASPKALKNYGDEVRKMADKQQRLVEGEETDTKPVFDKMKEMATRTPDLKLRQAILEEMAESKMELPASTMVKVVKRGNKHVREAAQAFKDMLHKLGTGEIQPGSQMETALPSFRRIVERTSAGIPLTAIEYMVLMHHTPQHFHEGKWKGRWVVCSSRQAMILLAMEQPCLSILVVDGAPNTMTEAQVIEWLDSHGKPFDVHDLFKAHPGSAPRSRSSGSAAEEEGERWDPDSEEEEEHYMSESDFEEQQGQNASDAVHWPIKMTASEFKAQMDDPDGRPLNILSLSSFNKNPVPECLIANIDYDLIRTTVLDDLVPGKTPGNPLVHCTSFGLFALAHAMSFLHVDQSGVLTTATCHFGRKLWITLTGMPHSRYRAWGVRDTPLPKWAYVAIPLEAGDVLIQPPGTVHAPYSGAAVAMSGTMHLSKRCMLASATTAHMAMENPSLTNEEVEIRIGEVFELIRQRWQLEVDDPAKGWGSRNELRQYSDVVERIKSHLGRLLATKKGKKAKRRKVHDIKADDFKFGTDKNVSVGLPYEVNMVDRATLKRPTGESIAGDIGAAARRSLGRIGTPTSGVQEGRLALLFL